MSEESSTTKRIDTLEVDGKSYAVADMPENIQNLVNVFNDWREERVEMVEMVRSAQNALIKQDAALRMANQEIMIAFKQHMEPATDDGQVDDGQVDEE